MKNPTEYTCTCANRYILATGTLCTICIGYVKDLPQEEDKPKAVKVTVYEPPKTEIMFF